MADVFPYIAYYPHIQYPIIGVLSLLNMFYHNGPIPSVPSPISLLKYTYDHTGISAKLEESIQFYHVLLYLEDKVRFYIKIHILLQI